MKRIILTMIFISLAIFSYCQIEKVYDGNYYQNESDLIISPTRELNRLKHKNYAVVNIAHNKHLDSANISYFKVRFEEPYNTKGFQNIYVHLSFSDNTNFHFNSDTTFFENPEWFSIQIDSTLLNKLKTIPVTDIQCVNEKTGKVVYRILNEKEKYYFIKFYNAFKLTEFHHE